MLLLLLPLVLWLCLWPAWAADEAWLIPRDARFRPDGQAVIEKKYDVQIDGIRVTQRESGLYNGLSYHFWFEDGRGSFGRVLPSKEETLKWTPAEAADWDSMRWHVSCHKNLSSDHKFCMMYLPKLSLFLSVHASMLTALRISVGTHHYPGSSIALRIQSEKAFITRAEKGFDGQTSATILKKLSTNPTVTTQYRKWPDESSIDKRAQVFAFPEAYAYITWAVRQIR